MYPFNLVRKIWTDVIGGYSFVDRPARHRLHCEPSLWFGSRRVRLHVIDVNFKVRL